MTASLTERIQIIHDELQNLSSRILNLRCDAEDDGATEAAADIEAAQDAVDGACENLRAARQYATYMPDEDAA